MLLRPDQTQITIITIFHQRRHCPQKIRPFSDQKFPRQNDAIEKFLKAACGSNNNSGLTLSNINHVRMVSKTFKLPAGCGCRFIVVHSRPYFQVQMVRLQSKNTFYLKTVGRKHKPLENRRYFKIPFFMNTWNLVQSYTWKGPCAISYPSRPYITYSMREPRFKNLQTETKTARLIFLLLKMFHFFNIL